MPRCLVGYEQMNEEQKTQRRPAERVAAQHEVVQLIQPTVDRRKRMRQHVDQTDDRTRT